MEPASVRSKPPEAVNILTAISENERIVGKVTEPEKRMIPLTWLFHLIGDVHQPLHTVALFTREYPNVTVAATSYAFGWSWPAHRLIFIGFGTG